MRAFVFVQVARAMLAIALSCAWHVASAQAPGGSPQDARASAPVVPIFVATPATPQRWIANQGAFLFVYRDPGGDSSRAAFLRRWAKDDRFDLAKRTQAAMLEAIATRGRLALPLAVPRAEQIEPSPLARDQLPETALRGELLDVAVEWFGVTASGPFADYQPFVRVSYRVLDSRGGLVRPTHVVYYNKVRGADLPKAHGIDVDPTCAWKNMEAMAKERSRVWACFGAAIQKIAEHVAVVVVPGPS